MIGSVRVAHVQRRAADCAVHNSRFAAPTELPAGTQALDDVSTMEVDAVPDHLLVLAEATSV